MSSDTLYLGLSSGENFGWGVCSRYLSTELAKKTRIAVLDDQDVTAVYQNLPGKLFMALTDVELFPLFEKARGKNNFGYTFFENELTGRSITNAENYDIVFAGSTWCRDRMLEKGIANCDILLQGIDPTFYYPITEEKEDGYFVIFSGGKFEFRKGQDLVLRAVKILQQKYPDIILVNCWQNMWPKSMELMGNSPHIRYEYQGNNWFEVMQHIYAINGLDVNRILTFPLMPHEKLREVYQKTDIGLFPNRCEGGTNLVLMEYMACAKPVIASNTSGHKDIVSSENAILLDSFCDVELVDEGGNLSARWQEPSVEELVSAIEYAYHNRDAIRRLGKRAGEDLRHFTWEQSAESLLARLQGV